MATEHREIIYTIKLDVAATNQQLNQFTTQAQQAAQANKALQDSTQEATAAAKRQEDAAKKTKQAVEAEEGSIKSLREENKKLTEQRNATSLATEEGRKKVEMLNKQLDENNKLIKDNVDQYTKQKIGVGDYKGALDKLIPGLGATADGFMNCVKAARAFIATGIGAVLAAVGLAVGALTKYFQGSEEGQNRWNKIVAIGSALLEKFWDIVENVGEALYNIATKPKQAFTDLVDFIKNNLINRFTALGVIIEGIKNLDFKQVANGVLQLGTGVVDVIGKTQQLFEEVKKTYNEAIDQGTKLAALQAQIDKDERDMLVRRSQTNLEVSKLRRQAVSQEGDEKRATIKEAIALEEALADKELAAKKRLLEQAQLELKTNGDDKEAKLKVAQATAAVIDAEAQRYEATLRFSKEIEALDQAEADRKKAMADKIAADQVAAEKKRLDDMYALQDVYYKDQAKRDADKLKKDKETAEAEKKIDKLKTDSLLGTTNLLFKEKSQARVALTSIFKADSMKETVINTKAAAVAAFKSLAGIPIIGPILGAAAAAAVGLFGATQLASIAGVSFAGFAKGGQTKKTGLSGTKIMPGMGIPISRPNGDNMLATVRTNEVILNEQHQAALGGSRTFKAIGVPGFATSGFTSLDSRVPSFSSSSSPDIDYNRLADLIAQQTIVVRVTDINSAQQERSAAESRAQII